MMVQFLLTLLSISTFSGEYYVGDQLIVSTHYSPPWSLGDCSGAEIDIIKASFKEVGISIKCETTAYARLVKNFTAKKTLFASPVVKQEGEKVGAYYSDSFIDYVDVAVSFKQSKSILSDFSSKNVIAYQKAKDYLGEEYAKWIKKTESYKELPGRDAQIKMLKAGRVDFVVGEKNILHSLSRDLYPKNKLHTNIVLKKWDVRAGSHDKELMMKFNKGLRIIKKRGLVEKIYKKYGIIK